MRTVFLDTAWAVALLRPRDQNHRKAIALLKQLDRARFVTHRGVLFEIGNAFSKRLLRADAVRYLASLKPTRT